MSFLTDRMSGLYLISAICKTVGLWLVILQEWQAWPHFIRALGLVILVASWYILDFYYRKRTRLLIGLMEKRDEFPT